MAAELKVILNEITCNKRSYGPGDDNIVIAVMLYDPKNQNRVAECKTQVLGEFDAGFEKPTSGHPPIVVIDDTNAPAIDSLACLFAVVKVASGSQFDITKFCAGHQSAVDYLNSLLQLPPAPTLNLGGKAGGIDLVIDLVLALIWKIRGSAGFTVTLGMDDRLIKTTPPPPGASINGQHPSLQNGDPVPPLYYQFACQNFEANYDVHYTVFGSGY